MQEIDYEQKIQELEKANRILQKKLERSEANRIALEETNEKKEFLFLKVIDELRNSQVALEERGQELEAAIKNLQAMQSKLVESEKMSALGVLVAGIAHEINNPVNFIYGNLIPASEYADNLLQILQYYQQYYPNPDRQLQLKIKKIDLDFIQADFPKLLESMKIGAERIRDIVCSLRTFSRLDEAEVKKVNIHEGIDSTLMILQSRLNTKSHSSNIKVIKEYCSELPLVECYAGKLNQVFMNILVNAIDALEQQIANDKSSVCDSEFALNSTFFTPTISITTQDIGNWISVRIADNGHGISEEIKQQIFNPFFTTKPVGKGTGLGLSISYQIIVEDHQGQLECYSHPGKGTEFVIMLPKH